MPPPPTSLFLPFHLCISLSVFQSRFVYLIQLSHSLPLSLFCPLSPPCLSFFPSVILSHAHTAPLSLPFALMSSTNGREANSAVTLNEKWQAIAAAHSHRCVDANNKTQRLDFIVGDFGLLFWNQSIAIDERNGKGERGMHI